MKYFHRITKQKTASVLSATVSLFLISVTVAYAGPGDNVIPNPLPRIASLPCLIKAILGVVVKVGMPVIAVLFVWTGFKFLSAQGDEKKLTEAKSSFLWTVVGAAVLLGSWALASAIASTISAIGGAQGQTSC